MKKMAFFLGIILLIAVMLSSCTAYLRAVTHAVPEPERIVMRVNDDQFEQSIEVLGIDATWGLNSENYHSYFLRSWIDKRTVAVTHQLYVTLYYQGNWRFFESASSQDAKPLTFVSIRRHVITCEESRVLWRPDGCQLVEDFVAIIDHETLRKHRDSGYSVKFRSRSAGDEIIVNLSPDQIRNQIGMVESIVGDIKNRQEGRR